MRPIDADALMDNIKLDTKKAIEEDDKVGSFWLGYAAGLVIKEPTIKPVATDTNVGNNSEIPNSSDAISRQVAIDAIVQCTNCGDEDALREYVLKHSLDNGWTGGILEALDAVKDLPTAQPEPHEGHWIEGGIYRDVIECNCSECGQLMTTAVTVRMNFCPNCGAKMTISIK